MEISINTPALLFPAISFLMLIYSNRFLALANLIRELRKRYNTEIETRPTIIKQLKNLKTRLTMIRTMQALGVSSFLFCIICMYLIYTQHMVVAHALFAFSLFMLMVSMIISLLEIQISTKALEHELNDMEELEQKNSFVGFIKNTFSDITE